MRHPLRRLGAPKYPSASLECHRVDEDPTAKPRMPGIKYFPLFGPVGVMLSSCTMAPGFTTHSAKTLRSIERSSASVALALGPFSAAFTTNIAGFDLRHTG